MMVSTEPRGTDINAAILDKHDPKADGPLAILACGCGAEAGIIKKTVGGGPPSIACHPTGSGRSRPAGRFAAGASGLVLDVCFWGASAARRN